MIMSKITDFDKNFLVETELKKDNIHFYNAKQSPFHINGLLFENGHFRRIPEAVAGTVSPGVEAHHLHTAGGRIRFRTNSDYIAIQAKMSVVNKMPHFPLTGSAGFDLFGGTEKEQYIRAFVPPLQMTDGYESLIELGSNEMRNITIHFPLYSSVEELYIGLNQDAEILPPLPYAIEKPVVYYGSSITQGGCASRPGNAYPAILTRRFGCDHINLGFSGNAKGEDTIAAYISKLEMSAFVYDYDHNAPNLEHLQQTHERMFQTIRGAQPQLPILILSRPKYTLTAQEEDRRSLIRATYENAVAQGDNNVYFLDGKQLMALAEDNGTVDDAHPNDWGFMSMAAAVDSVLKNIL